MLENTGHCPYCRRDLDEFIEEKVLCKICLVPHCPDCWRDNDQKCAIFGCGSTALAVTESNSVVPGKSPLLIRAREAAFQNFFWSSMFVSFGFNRFLTRLATLTKFSSRLYGLISRNLKAVDNRLEFMAMQMENHTAEDRQESISAEVRFSRWQAWINKVRGDGSHE